MEEGADLKEIWELQKVDSAIKSLEDGKEKLPAELLPFRDNWEVSQNELSEMRKIFEGMQVERKGKEGEVIASEEEIKKKNIQLYSLKSNKEYTAMLKEIEDLKNKNKELEDNILELMENGERYIQATKEKEREVKAQEVAFKKEEERVNKEIAEIEIQLASKRQERDNQRNKVDASLYQKYEKIRQGKKGLGIVAIIDNCCGGCHINLPPQVVNEVKMRKIVFCGSCARLLYWEGNSE